MRNEMIGAIVRRAIEHPGFRNHLIENPREALDTHGFALEAAELEELDRISSDLKGGSSGDVEQKLVSIAQKYGVSLQQNA